MHRVPESDRLAVIGVVDVHDYPACIDGERKEGNVATLRKMAAQLIRGGHGDPRWNQAGRVVLDRQQRRPERTGIAAEDEERAQHRR